MNPFKNAHPIWHPQGSHINQTVEFRTHFSVSDPASTLLYLHVNTTYALYINGTFVDSGSFSDFPEDRSYDTLSLKKAAVPGDNVFSLYAVYQGKHSFTAIDYPPEVLFSLTEKGEEILLSDAGVPVREETRFLSDVPDISPQLAFSFEYDQRLPLEPFMPAVLIAEGAQSSSAPVLRPRPVSKLVIDPPAPATVSVQGSFLMDPEETSDLPAVIMQSSYRQLSRPLEPASFPVTVDENGFVPDDDPGVTFTDHDVILDLGSEMVGFFHLDIELPQEAQVLVGWGEHLEDSHVRTRIGVRSFAARLTLPAGNSVFFFPFKRMACRYIELQVCLPKGTPFTLYYAGLRPVYYPLKKLNEFSCDDKLHEQIYRTSMRTLLNCMHEHYEDCPWREQALYTMDSRNQMLTGYYTFEEYDFAKSSLRLISHGLREDGYLELINPGRAGITIPSFTAIYLIQAAEYLKYTEDFQFIREILPACRKIAAGLVRQIDDTGLIPRPTDPKYWNFYEWQTGLDGHSAPGSGEGVYDAPLNAFAVLALLGMASMETALGYPKEADDDLGGVYRIRKAFHDTFFDAEAGYYKSFSFDGATVHCAELTQALAVCADLVPEEALDSVLEALAYQADRSEKGPEADRFQRVTLSHSVFKYEALLRRPEVYTTFVFDDVAKLYGSMLRRGATTFWETIDGGDAFANAGSLCHGWSAVPAFLYMKYVLDTKEEGTLLDPDLTGIRNASIQPLADPAETIFYRY